VPITADNQSDFSVKPRFQVGALVVARYEVVEVRAGGMGEVAICRDTKTANSPLVAIKSLHAASATEASITRFRDEACALAAVGRAPFGFILPLSEVINDGSAVLLKMDFCPGGNLADRIRSGRMTKVEVVDVATQVLIGLYELNVKLGLVHRDIKPTNILFDEGRVQICDLGVARFVGAIDEGNALAPHQSVQRTQTGAFVGTYQYAAPEQILGTSSIDARADMWAFGVVVYEMLMGRCPYPDDPPEDHLIMILNHEPANLGELERRSSPVIRRIIIKCLAPRRSDRYETFDDLITAWDEAIRTPRSPVHYGPGFDYRIELPDESPANAAWNGKFFPERLDADVSLIRVDLSAATGLVEARDYYRMDRYEDAIMASTKTLGELDVSTSIISRLFAGELDGVSRMEKNGALGIRATPSSVQAIDALCWQMRALVALIEEPAVESSRWLERLKDLADRVMLAKIVDHDLVALAAEGYLLAEQYQKAYDVSYTVLAADPMHRVAGWTAFQALRRNNRVDGAQALANILIPEYLKREDGEYDRVAVRLAYACEDWAKVIELTPDVLSRSPNDVELLGLLTSAFTLAGDRESAYQCYQRMESLDPTASWTVLCREAFAKRPVAE
jgi:tetratricopeptide (TPR) repeat protein